MSTATTTSRTHTVLDSPLGPLTLVGENGALVGLYLPDHRRGPEAASLGPSRPAGFSAARTQLEEYFAGSRTVFDLPLAPVGSTFQLRVWEALAAIAFGKTRTYSELARALGDVRLTRAVGTANARNPLSIVVPCHRVVGADGRLTGYAGGLEAKRALLELEGGLPQSTLL